ncbi:MAG TPA: hypothetical protein VJ783_05130 [Pirellulales bacterium]|nr:hypothetical protein [Pirellulales bacterium]
MLPTTPYFTTALPYGLLSQLFSSPIKSAIDSATQISSVLQGLATTTIDGIPVGNSPEQFIPELQNIAAAAPIFTIFELSGQGSAPGSYPVLSLNAPLFDIVA